MKTKETIQQILKLLEIFITENVFEKYKTNIEGNLHFDYETVVLIYVAFSNEKLETVPLRYWKRFKHVMRLWETELIDELTALNISAKEIATILHNLTTDPKTFLESIKIIEKHTDTKEQQELGEI